MSIQSQTHFEYLSKSVNMRPCSCLRLLSIVSNDKDIQSSANKFRWIDGQRKHYEISLISLFFCCCFFFVFLLFFFFITKKKEILEELSHTVTRNILISAHFFFNYEKVIFPHNSSHQSLHDKTTGDGCEMHHSQFHRHCCFSFKVNYSTIYL